MLQNGLDGGLVVGHTLGQPGLFVAHCVQVLPALNAVAGNLLKGATGHDHGCRDGVQPSVLRVAHHQPVIGIEQRKPLGQRFDGVLQQLPRLLGFVLRRFECLALLDKVGDVQAHRHHIVFRGAGFVNVDPAPVGQPLHQVGRAAAVL
ncbi:hypothetical protein D3C71_1008940 [compost metagenome]